VDLQQWPEEQWNKEHPRFLQRSKGFVEAALQKNGALRRECLRIQVFHVFG
jgi:hypothetical protein